MDGDVAFEVHVYEGREAVVHFVEGGGFLRGGVGRGGGGEGAGSVEDGVFGGREHVDEVIEEEVWRYGQSWHRGTERALGFG